MAVSMVGRPLECGTGSFKLNPQLGRLLQSSMSRLNASKMIKGDKVHVTLKDSVLNLKVGGMPPFGLNVTFHIQVSAPTA